MIKCSELDYCTKTINIEKLVNEIKNGNIVLDNAEISEKTKQFAITSLIGQIPLNTIYAYRKNDSYVLINSSLIKAIYDFINGEFKYDSVIDGFESSYYSEFSVPLKRKIKETYVNMILFYSNTDSIKEYVELLSENC